MSEEINHNDPDWETKLIRQGINQEKAEKQDAVNKYWWGYIEKAFCIGFLNADYGDRWIVDVINEELNQRWELCKNHLLKLMNENKNE
jgi:hypothetical protein